MEESLRTLIGKNVLIEGAGKRKIAGTLIDAGADLLVMEFRQRYLYIPLAHVHQVREDDLKEGEQADYEPAPYASPIGQTSMERMLQAAQGLFVEVHIAGSGTMTGFITRTRADYFVLYSPLYPELNISLKHLKCLIPHPAGYDPYSGMAGRKVGAAAAIAAAAQSKQAESFREQIRLAEGRLAVFNVGGADEEIGIVQLTGDGLVEIGDASGARSLYAIDHLKTMYVPAV